MSNIDKRALREAAEKATPGNWWIDSHGQAMVSFIDNDVLEVFATDNKRAAVRHEDTGNLSRWRNDNDATFIATADPATVLALLDELEAAENRINRLEAIVAVAEQRNALMREWKRALKVPCDLVDGQVPVVIHGMVIRLERLKETEAKLEVAEKRNERALALLKDANTENVWEIIGRLKVVISGDYRSEAEIAAAATAEKGE